MAFLPTDTATEFISSITTALTANIAPVLGIFGFMVAVRFVMRMLNRSTRGRI